MSLKSLLGFRKHVKDVARQELDAIVRDLQERVEDVRKLEGEIGKLLGEIARREQEGTEAADVLALYRYAEALATALASGRRRVAVLTAQREEKQALLLSAARDVRTVEILETRRDRAQAVEEDRREQRTTDEFGLRKWRDGDGHAAPQE